MMRATRWRSATTGAIRPESEWATRIGSSPALASTSATAATYSSTPAVGSAIGRSTVRARWPRFSSSGTTRSQHHDPCQAPWTRTKVATSADAQRQRARPPNLPARPAHGVGVGEMEDRERVEEDLERHPQLHARQMGTSTAMDAQAEGGVAVVLTVEDHLVRLLERCWISVGSGERQQAPVVRLHRTTVPLHVV